MVRQSTKANVDADIDMTPMIDVVFLLIIFFLCIDFKTLEAKLPAYLPKDKGPVETHEEPVEQLSIKIVCDRWGEEITRNPYKPLIDPETGRKNAYALRDHRIHWEVGPKRFDALDKLLVELEDLAKDPARRIPDNKNPGQRKLMAVVVEPAPGSTYGDVASTLDAVTKSGFEEINFGGGFGRRDQKPR